MNTYSRRSFLKLSGIALSATALQPLQSLRLLEEQTHHQGRALAALPVYQKADFNAPVIAHRWPDSVVTILEDQQAWYRIEDGFVPRAEVQPILAIPANANLNIPNEPFWAEVVGTVAVIRQHCAANAPLVTRIGHGGVAQVIDRLPGTPSNWYAIADSKGGLLGWTQSSVWHPVQQAEFNAADRLLQIDTQAQQITAFENDAVMLQAPASLNGVIASGTYHWQEQQMGGYQADAYHGVPWVTRFGSNYTITGIYWHNRFGESIPGPTVQLTPLLARWLYGWLTPSSRIQIT